MRHLAWFLAAALLGCGADGGGSGGSSSPTPPPNPPSGNVEVDWEDQFTLLPRDAQGWSIFTPSPDSRILYVSAAGSDATGAVYTPASPEIGADPFQPAGAVQAFATPSAALAQARDGYPDWVLLRKGDVWVTPATINAKAGRSASERSLVGAYGSGTVRPLIKHGAVTGLTIWDKSFVAVAGLAFLAHTRNFASPEFVSTAGNNGFWSFANSKVSQAILVEDCVFEFAKNNVVQGPYRHQDVVIRRSQFLNDYSADSHSQGLYSHGASILLEECLFDHNGWYVQQSVPGQNVQSGGQATMYNHNTYFTNASQCIFRKNLFLRSSSIQNKWTSNPAGPADEVLARDLLMDDNLYVEGEIGISAGGNNDFGTGYRWQNVHILNNVFLDIGRARPTNRSLGWGVDAIDWDGGRIAENVFHHYGETNVTNIYGIHVNGHTRDVEVARNLLHRLNSSARAMILGADPKQNLRITDNEFQLGGTNLMLVDASVIAGVSFSANVYDTDRAAGSWFRIQSADRDLAQWTAQTGDTGSTAQTLAYPDPTRTVETYHASLGRTATLDAFIVEAKRQTRGFWRPEYAAGAVTAWVRAGFGR